jgi:hypothetical protein
LTPVTPKTLTPVPNDPPPLPDTERSSGRRLPACFGEFESVVVRLLSSGAHDRAHLQWRWGIGGAMMAEPLAGEHVVLRSTLAVRREFATEEHRLDFRASYPPNAELPIDELVGTLAALCVDPKRAAERLRDCEVTCAELVAMAERGGDLTCVCDCFSDVDGSRFTLVCHAIDRNPNESGAS